MLKVKFVGTELPLPVITERKSSVERAGRESVLPPPPVHGPDDMAHGQSAVTFV
ncbi:hypothetical protein DPMN_060431 [Dreissena polymorpha]|uniref:Uncharacterized protein n=1 Tax=Dreissena polymorpha TaxID=45954 RepID=A0A9D4C5P6_DREPO|nr:hypothetical protein DPMN_060431 [Dreissena polymorpha]